MRPGLLRSLVLAAILLGAGFAAGGSLRAQCAMCEGTAAAGSDSGAAYNSSTMFMLVVPYLLLGCIGGYVAWTFRKPRIAPRQDDPGDPPSP